MSNLRDLLKRIRQWDALDIPNTDGAYWKREIDAALGQPEQCSCGDRPKNQCPGEWEPGCDLGNNPKYARRVALEQQEQEPVAWVNAAHLQAIQEKAKALGLTLGLFGYVEIYTNESQGRVPLHENQLRISNGLHQGQLAAPPALALMLN